MPLKKPKGSNFSSPGFIPKEESPEAADKGKPERGKAAGRGSQEGVRVVNGQATTSLPGEHSLVAWNNQDGPKLRKTRQLH